MPTLYGIRNTVTHRIISVVIAWLFGLILGACFLIRTSFTSLMCSVYFLRTSIVSLILSLSIPIFLSYILLRFFNYYYILPLVFVKGFVFCCIYGGVFLIYKNAGWLVSSMMLFSDFFLIIILMIHWFLAAIGKRCSLLFSFLFLLVIGCFDFFVVSPYLAMLLNY